MTSPSFFYISVISLKKKADENSMGFLRAFSSILIGVGFTAALFSLTTRTQLQLQTKNSLALTRQITDQLELLARSAQDRGEKNPFFWAARFLNSGSEDRPIHVSIISSDLVENEDFQSGQSQFVYLRRLRVETGETAKVELQVFYLGFLGSGSPLESDLFFASMSVLLTVLFLFTLHWFNSRQRSKPEVDFQTPMPQFESLHKASLSSEPSFLKPALTQLGLRVKFLTHSAKNLVQSSARIHELIPSVSEVASELSIESDILPFLQNWERKSKEFQEEKLKLQRDVEKLNCAISESTQEMLNLVKLTKSVK